MKKDRSNRSEPLRSTLPKHRILRGDPHFASLFRASTTLRRPTVHLKFRIFGGEPGSAPDQRVAFLTPRRIGGAVDRNTMRRRMREIYRQHQDDLFPALERRLAKSSARHSPAAGTPRGDATEAGADGRELRPPSMHAVFICQKADIPSRDLELDMLALMSSCVTKAGERIVG